MEDIEKDVRLLRRNLAKGFVSQDKVNAILDELPDVEDQAEWIDPTTDAEPEAEGEAAPEEATGRGDG